MSKFFNPQTIDIVIFIIANFVNILLIGIFLSRAKKLDKVENILGIVLVALAVPVIAAVIFNFLEEREWWTVVLPLFLILFCVVELIFDYILKLEFRNTALLYPYLIIFYLALMGMIGYSFLIGESYGFVTLSTYFLNQLATWYSYSRVGHG